MCVRVCVSVCVCVGIVSPEPSNDQQEHPARIGMQPDRWVHKYYLTIPTAWTAQTATMWAA